MLAAGAGSRFGGTKQLATVRGKPLVQHPIDAAAGEVDEVVVVLGHDADAVEAALALPPHARVVRNPRYAEGQASSLAEGLAACSSDSAAAVVLLADQPGIRAEHVRALVRAYREDPRPAAVRLRFRDGPGPALLARRIWPELGELRGDVGARAWLEAHPEAVAWIEIDEPAPPDVDRPEDLERARDGEEPRQGRGSSPLQLGREGLAVEDDRHPESPV